MKILRGSTCMALTFWRSGTRGPFGKATLAFATFELCPKTNESQEWRAGKDTRAGCAMQLEALDNMGYQQNDQDTLLTGVEPETVRAICFTFYIVLRSL